MAASVLNQNKTKQKEVRLETFVVVLAVIDLP